MIYVDTSIALAHLLSEDRRPPEQLWTEELISSRLLEYELWTWIHRLDLSRSHGDVARGLLARLAFLEMDRMVFDRARDSFPRTVRTLDALHLASASFLHAQGIDLSIASYDRKLISAARAMGLAIYAV